MLLLVPIFEEKNEGCGSNILPPRSPEQHQVQMGTFVDLVQMATKQVEAEVIKTEANNKNELPPAPDSSDKRE